MSLVLLGRDLLGDDLLIFERAAAIPNDGIGERPFLVIEETDRAALARQADRLVGRSRQRCLFDRLLRCVADAGPYRFDILLAPSRIGRDAGIFLIAVPERIAALVEDHHGAACRSGIDADEGPHTTRWHASSPAAQPASISSEGREMRGDRGAACP